MLRPEAGLAHFARGDNLGALRAYFGGGWKDGAVEHFMGARYFIAVAIFGFMAVGGVVTQNWAQAALGGSGLLLINVFLVADFVAFAVMRRRQQRDQDRSS